MPAPTDTSGVGASPTPTVTPNSGRADVGPPPVGAEGLDDGAAPVPVTVGVGAPVGPGDPPPDGDEPGSGDDIPANWILGDEPPEPTPAAGAEGVAAPVRPGADEPGTTGEADTTGGGDASGGASPAATSSTLNPRHANPAAVSV